MAPRMTLHTLLILQALLQNPSREMYGLELSEETGLLPGTAYPILLRLENEGWLVSRWEDIVRMSRSARLVATTASRQVVPSRRARRARAPGDRLARRFVALPRKAALRDGGARPGINDDNGPRG